MIKFYVLPPNMAELRKLSEHAHYLQRLNLAPTECTQSDRSWYGWLLGYNLSLHEVQTKSVEALL